MLTEKIKLDEQIAILDNETEMASLLLFHPLETMLIVSDNKDMIRCADLHVSVQNNNTNSCICLGRTLCGHPKRVELGGQL